MPPNDLGLSCASNMVAPRSEVQAQPCGPSSLPKRQLQTFVRRRAGTKRRDLCVGRNARELKVTIVLFAYPLLCNKGLDPTWDSHRGSKFASRHPAGGYERALENGAATRCHGSTAVRRRWRSAEPSIRALAG